VSSAESRSDDDESASAHTTDEEKGGAGSEGGKKEEEEKQEEEEEEEEKQEEEEEEEDQQEEGEEEEQQAKEREIVKMYVGKKAKLRVDGYIIGKVDVLGVVDSGDSVLAGGLVEVSWARVNNLVASRAPATQTWDFSNGEVVLVSGDGKTAFSTIQQAVEFGEKQGPLFEQEYYVYAPLLQPN
jgi:ATP-dependent 26S proteasome regulatory subunit